MTTNAVDSPITVSGLSGKVLDVEVTTNITHTANGDLEISLIGPTGKQIALSAFNGTDYDDVFNGTAWDDGADPGTSASATTPNEGLAGDHTYANGVVVTRLVPDEALGAFLDDEPNGVWKLHVWDAGNLDTGTIQSWSVSIATTTSTAGFGNVGVGSTASAYTVPNGGSVTATFSHRGGDGPLRSVAVRLNNLMYAGFADLELRLRSPSGTVITLSRANQLADRTSPQMLSFLIPSGPVGGSSYPLSGFGDPSPITLIDPTSSPLQVGPEEPLSALTGEDAAGVWTLTATDIGGIAGGGSFGQVLLDTGFWKPCAAPIDLAVSGPPAVALGDRVTYSATLTPRGPGITTDAAIELATGGLIDLSVTASSGAQCTSTAQNATCKWPGETSPGINRTMSVTGMQAVTGTNGAGAFITGRSLSALPVYRQLGWLAVVPSTKYRALNGSKCTVLGTDGNDDLTTFGALGGVICGRGGNDAITTTDGKDTVDGGAGNDTINAKAGADKIFGGKGNDTIIAGKGNDTIDGGAGKDKIDAGTGNDRIIGGLGKDTINGNVGRDAAKRDRQDVFKRVEVFFTK